MSNREILEIKNDFLKELREIEIKLDEKLEKCLLELETKNQAHEDKINSTFQKNEQLYNSMIDQKIKVEKITELYISQKRLNDILTSHEVRINNLVLENKKINKNYDKIVADNLIVSGYIGASCKYKNLSEYIEYNINEVQKLKNEKENNKRLTDDIKNKIDNFMRNMLTLVDNSVTRCKQYTDNKQIYVENLLNSKLVEFNEKNMDLRTQIFSNLSKTNRQVEILGIKLEEGLINIKEEIYKEIDNKIQEIKTLINEIQKNNIDEYTNLKLLMNDIVDKKLEEFYKKLKYNRLVDFKLKRNENLLTPNIKTFKDLNRKEELLNTLNIKDVKKINNEEEIKSRIFKRKNLMSSKAINKKLLETKEEKEENKTEIEHSKDESINKFDENNIIKNADLLTLKEEKNIENEKKENENDTLNDNIKQFKSDNINDDNNIKSPKSENINDDLLQQIENKNKMKQNIDNTDISLNNNITNNNNNGNYSSSIKSFNSNSINNMKASFNQRSTIPGINDNNNNEIMIEENGIRMPQINGNIKINENDKLNNKFYTNKNDMEKFYSFNNNNNKKNIESRNGNNSLNYFKLSKEEEKDLKSINSDKSIFEKNKYNYSPLKFNSIETQTKYRRKGKNQKLGFNYKIINLGSDINFNENEFELIQRIREHYKKNINLVNPLTKTYKTYQKKKNEKKNVLQLSVNELPLNADFLKQNFFISSFNHTISNNSYYHKKKKHQSIDYEYINLKK